MIKPGYMIELLKFEEPSSNMIYAYKLNEINIEYFKLNKFKRDNLDVNISMFTNIAPLYTENKELDENHFLVIGYPLEITTVDSVGIYKVYIELDTVTQNFIEGDPNNFSLDIKGEIEDPSFLPDTRIITVPALGHGYIKYGEKNTENYSNYDSFIVYKQNQGQTGPYTVKQRHFKPSFFRPSDINQSEAITNYKNEVSELKFPKNSDNLSFFETND